MAGTSEASAPPPSPYRAAFRFWRTLLASAVAALSLFNLAAQIGRVEPSQLFGEVLSLYRVARDFAFSWLPALFGVQVSTDWRDAVIVLAVMIGLLLRTLYAFYRGAGLGGLVIALVALGFVSLYMGQGEGPVVDGGPVQALGDTPLAAVVRSWAIISIALALGPLVWSMFFEAEFYWRLLRYPDRAIRNRLRRTDGEPSSPALEVPVVTGLLLRAAGIYYANMLALAAVLLIFWLTNSATV